MVSHRSSASKLCWRIQCSMCQGLLLKALDLPGYREELDPSRTQDDADLRGYREELDPSRTQDDADLRGYREELDPSRTQDDADLPGLSRGARSFADSGWQTQTLRQSADANGDEC